MMHRRFLVCSAKKHARKGFRTWESSGYSFPRKLACSFSFIRAKSRTQSRQLPLFAFFFRQDSLSMIYRCFINALSSIDLAFSLVPALFGARLGRSVVSRLLGAGGNSDGNAYRRRMSDQSNPLGPPTPWKLPTGTLLVGMPIEALSKAKRCDRNSHQRRSSHLAPL